MKVNLLFGYELNCYINRRYKRTGVCSQKFDEQDKHILLWDFDNADIDKITFDLKKIQREYYLPTIYVIESSENHYHAYCFASRTFVETINIISSTLCVCENFLRLGMIRGYYTLRISLRQGEQFKLIKKIHSEYPDEILPSEVTLSDYITYNGGRKNEG